jgi:uncharacterized lipoprotein YehR (DUF1307 family)
MKKNILYTMLFALVALVMTSCGDKKSEGLSRITYYPSIQLKGDSYLVWEKGVAYEEPGYVSELNGEDVTSQVTVSGAVDVNKSGIYTLTYTTVKNSDGFDASASRTVVVLDSSSAIEGFYMNQATSNRNGTAYGKNFQVLVIDNGDGTISVDDLLGGWYCQRAGYGTKYAMSGVLGVAEDGTLTLIDSYIPGWGDGLDSFEGKFDAATSTINFVCVYAGSLTFTETWVKQ